MSVVLAIVFVMALGGVLVAPVLPELVSQLRRERLLRSVRQAEAEVSVAAQEARRAMNDAAGQGWRNRFE
jgi:type II secretory pathway pseudopilin PulG